MIWMSPHHIRKQDSRQGTQSLHHKIGRLILRVALAAQKAELTALPVLPMQQENKTLRRHMLRVLVAIALIRRQLQATVAF